MDKVGFSSTSIISLNNNLYQCLKDIYSYKMVLLLLTTSPYKISLHTLIMFNSILSLQKASNKQTRWSYRMSWPHKTLTKWTLQNVQLCLLGVLLQNAPVRVLIVTTKCLYINHLEQGRPLPKCKGQSKSNGYIYIIC